MSNRMINKRMTSIEWMMLITPSLVWGGSFFFVGVIVKELPPQTIVFCRVLIAAVALHIYMKATGRRMPITYAAWSAFLRMGLLNNVIPFSLIVWGQIHIASGVASILNATMPLFTVVIAHVLTGDEKVTSLRIGGVVSGLVGVAIMIGGGGLADGWTNGIAQLALICGAVSYAFASIYGRRFRQLGIDPYTVATGQLTASTLLIFPIMMVVDQPWTLSIPSTGSIWALLALGIASSAFAYILYFKILSSAGSTNISLVTFLVPVSAIFLGIIFLNEQLLSRHIAGLVLIGFGLLLVDGRLFKKL